MESKERIVLPFLLGTFLLSYLSWGVIILANQFNRLAYGTPVSTIFFLIGGFSPTIVSTLLLIRKKKVSGFRQILKDTFHFRQKPMVYLTIAGFTGLTYLFHALAGNVVIQHPLYYVIILLPMMIFGGGLEEVGWRYLLQPELEKKFSFTVSSAMVGVIWAIWHLPLFYIQGSSQNLYMSFPLFALDVFGTAFVLALLRKIGAGIWPCVFFHCQNNALGSTLGINETLVPTLVTMVALVFSAVIYNLIIEGRKKPGIKAK